MTVLEQEAAVAPKLPVWQTAKTAFRDTFGNLGVVAVAAAVPFGLSMLLDAVAREQDTNVGLYLVFQAANTVIVALFELSWLRFLLMGRGHGTPRALPATPRRILVFVGYSLALLVLFLPPMVLSQITEHRGAETPPGVVIATLALYLLATYLWARLSFICPWIAVDAPERFAASWRTTAGNALRLLFTIILVGLPFVLLAGAVLFILAMVGHNGGQPMGAIGQGGVSFWVLLGIGNLLLYLYSALSCAVLAQAFCILTGWQRERRELLERFE